MTGPPAAWRNHRRRKRAGPDPNQAQRTALARHVGRNRPHGEPSRAADRGALGPPRIRRPYALRGPFGLEVANNAGATCLPGVTGGGPRPPSSARLIGPGRSQLVAWAPINVGNRERQSRSIAGWEPPYRLPWVAAARACQGESRWRMCNPGMNDMAFGESRPSRLACPRG